MSTFAVTIERISEVQKHPNADKLSLAKVQNKDFEFVTALDQFEVGDYVVYFPVDSVLPTWVIEYLNLKGLDGKDKNRLRTVRLRGIYSQGIVANFDIIMRKPVEGSLVFNPQLHNDLFVQQSDKIIGYDLTEYFGVKKYEAPVPELSFSKGVKSYGGLPKDVKVYDLEGAQNHVNIAEMLMDVPVLVTEKMEGSHFSVTIYRDRKIFVCSRRQTVYIDNANNIVDEIKDNTKLSLTKYWNKTKQFIQKRFKIKVGKDLTKDYHNLIVDNLWVKCYKKLELKTVMNVLADFYFSDKVDNNENECITLRGEMIGSGIQGNIYKLDEHNVTFFEMELNGKPLGVTEFLFVCRKFNLYTAPVMSDRLTLRELLNGSSIKDFSNGNSIYDSVKHNTVLREGIVIRPIEEMYDDRFGRVILKQRSPMYLLETGM